MKKRLSHFVGVSIIGIVFAFVLMAATVYSTGAPAARTGAPGDGTCNTFGCHNSFQLNEGDGSVTILAPSEYEPGTPVDISIRVQKTGQTRFGFEITARDPNNQFVGSWNISSNHTFASGSSEYVTHANAPFDTDEHTFTVEYVPPSSNVGAITFYAAGNAANGNGNQQGDFIYTTSQGMGASTGTATEQEEIPSAFRVTSVFPNPVVSETKIEFELMRAASTRLDVYDSTGRLVKTVDGGMRSAGRHTMALDAHNLTGGIYVYRLTTSAGSESGKLLVVR